MFHLYDNIKVREIIKSFCVLVELLDQVKRTKDVFFVTTLCKTAQEKRLARRKFV